MPYKIGNGPPILDVFSSDNVFINGVKVALAGEGENAALPEASAAFSGVPQDDYVDIPEQYTTAWAETLEDYRANPDSYYSQEAADIEVRPNNPGTPDEGEASPSVPPINIPGAKDLIPWLTARLAEAKKGLWDETGVGKPPKPSNPNIVNIWVNLGLPYRDDQTPWCAGFMNFALKSCGYRYVRDAGAISIKNNPSKWGATEVAIAQGQPGDIVVWQYWSKKKQKYTHHVNFIYTAGGGGNIGPPFSFVGGNQSDKATASNNPSGGSITNSWVGGWTPAKGQVIGIFRPTKT